LLKKNEVHVRANTFILALSSGLSIVGNLRVSIDFVFNGDAKVVYIDSKTKDTLGLFIAAKIYKNSILTWEPLASNIVLKMVYINLSKV
jgi:hypothetical protein